MTIRPRARLRAPVARADARARSRDVIPVPSSRRRARWIASRCLTDRVRVESASISTVAIASRLAPQRPSRDVERSTGRR